MNTNPLIIRCEEGVTIRGENADELVAKLEAHFRVEHAELCGRFSREEILDLAVEETADQNATS